MRSVCNRSLIKVLSVFLCAFITLVAKADIEAETGSIKGIIITNDNKPAAMVTVTLKGTKKVTLTTDDGSYILRNVQPGTYELEVSLIGYQTIRQSVTVEKNNAATVDLQLQVSDMELQEVIIKSGVKSYKTGIVSPSLRITTPLLEAPQNIQVVTNKTLQDQQIISMSDGIVRNVSGTIRQEHWADMYTNIASRGSQVQAFRNGFNVVNSSWGPLTEDMSFVDHIEFVKGPAGFMLANGDPSGLYNVVTKKPTGQTKGSAEITTGSFDLYRATLDLDGKLSQDGKLLYRFNVMGQNKGSFRANEYNNRYSIAPVISYQVDEKTKLTIEYTLQHAKMSDVGSYYIFSTKGMGVLPRDMSFTPAGLPPTTMDDHSVFLNMQHQISNDWKLTAQGAYFSYQQTGSSMWPAAVNANGTVQRAVSSWDARSSMTLAQAFINGNINTGGVHHRILGGIDMGNKKYLADWGQYHVLDTVGAEFNPANPSLGVPSNGYPDFDHDKSTLEQRAIAAGGMQDLRYTSVYVQDELGFLKNTFRLTLAARYTDVSQSAYGGAAEKAKHFSPRVGLSVSLDKFTSVYGLYDQAFTPQTGKLSGGGSIKPITGNNIEFGIKRDWAKGKWNTTLAMYRILKNNELTADPNSAPNSGLSIVLGQKRSQGIEFDLRGKLTNNLSLIANYALTDSKVIKVADGVTAYKKGDIVPGYAKHVANTWLTYKIQSGALAGTGISFGGSYQAGRQTAWEVSPAADKTLPDFVKFDGGLFWESGKIRIAANVFNVFDKYTYMGSYYSWLGAYYWQADAPRNVRFSIGYNF